MNIVHLVSMAGPYIGNTQIFLTIYTSLTSMLLLAESDLQGKEETG